MKKLLNILILIFAAAQSQAAIHHEDVEYKHGDAVLEGYIAYDDAIQGKRPGVIVVPEWKGLGDNAKHRAELLAELGYIAFAIDMYGKGIRPTTHEEAGKLSGMFFSDRNLMRERARAGLDVLLKNPLTDTNKVAAIGYCFGGTTVLEMARSGAPLAGVVSFHGNLTTPNPKDAKNIKCKVLVLHGGNDAFTTPEQMLAFQDEMKKANVDWQMVFYGGAYHSFTVTESGDDPSDNVAYNEKADKRSWQAMKDFFAEIFGG